MFKMTEVKQVCEVVHGKPIPERTWIRWREKLELPKYLRYCSSGQMEQLITLANLRRKKPLNQITLRQVIDAKNKVLEEYRTNQQVPFIPSLCQGKNLPEIILACTGKIVSIKSLYRWGKDFDFRFSVNINYTKNDIEKWISIAHKY